MRHPIRFALALIAGLWAASAASGQAGTSPDEKTGVAERQGPRGGGAGGDSDRRREVPDEIAMLWSVEEKYDVVAPLLGEVQEVRARMRTLRGERHDLEEQATRLRSERERAGGADDRQREMLRMREMLNEIERELVEASDRLADRQLDGLFERAARDANRTVERARADGSGPVRHRVEGGHVREWATLATNLGKSGLVTTSNVDAKEFAEAFTGTWELTSRVSRGQPTDTSATILYDINPITGTGQVLNLEGGTAHAFVSPEGFGQDFSIGAMMDVNFQTNPGAMRLNEPTFGRLATVQTRNRGQILGSFGDFRSGINANLPTTFINQGGQYMVYGDLSAPAGSSEDDFVRIELVGEDTMIMVSSNADMKDVYRRTSRRRPRVAGLWSPKEFWEITSRPNRATEDADRERTRLQREDGIGEGPPHLFLNPPKRSVEP